MEVRLMNYGERNASNLPQRVEVTIASKMKPGTNLRWQVLNPTLSYIRDREAEGAIVTPVVDMEGESQKN